MKKLILAISVFTASTTFASQELKALTRCNEALSDKSAGRSEKLSTTAATPIMILSGKNIYFFTENSISVLENKFSNQDIVVRLEETEGSFFRKISFNKDRQLGSLSYQDLTKEEKQGALAPRAQLDADSLEILKKDLIKRMNSVTGEYQNKYDPQGTIEALNQCLEVKSPELQKSLDKQVAYYKAMTKKNSGYKKPKDPISATGCSGLGSSLFIPFWLTSLMLLRLDGHYSG